MISVTCCPGRDGTTPGFHECVWCARRLAALDKSQPRKLWLLAAPAGVACPHRADTWAPPAFPQPDNAGGLSASAPDAARIATAPDGVEVLTVSAGSPKPPAWASGEE